MQDDNNNGIHQHNKISYNSNIMLADLYLEILQIAEQNNFESFSKRLIDICLDTDDLVFYKKAADLLLPFGVDGSIGDNHFNLLKEVHDFLKGKKANPPRKILDINNLCKSYSHSDFNLGPINLELSEGEIIGLVGENGNGKTTLLRTVCGELIPTDGIVEYLFDYNDEYDLKSKLVYIPQQTLSWQGSLLDNLRFTAACYGIKGEKNLLMVDLVIARMGLWKYRTATWKHLSSGYKMRFELARMLLRTPSILLIDEPLANLDIVAQQIVLDDFRDIAKSPFRPIGIMLSSQQLYEVEKSSDKVIFLQNGRPKETSNLTHPEEEVRKCILEFECNLSFEEVSGLITSLLPEKLEKKGGTYIVQFPSTVTQNSFLTLFIGKGIEFSYFRNISNSTRRYFL